MRQRVIPILAPGTERSAQQGSCYQTKARGLEVLHSPLLNKGTAFTAGERAALGLVGLLPPDVGTLDSQVKRAYLQYEGLPDGSSRNSYLTSLQDRNEVLFYRLFSDHLREMIPVVNDVMAGIAVERHRRPRGVYLSIDHPEAIEESLANLGLGAEDVDLIVATDAEHIQDAGDWGIRGFEAPIGKLATYTAAGGIDPTRVIPVMLDVGTDRESLREDPTYAGARHARVRGEQYDQFIDAYVNAAARLFPLAILHWEDFAPGNGRRLLHKYRHRICTFNEDLQGTGAIVLAAVISAVRVCGTLLRNHRVLIHGAGTAGIGVADQMRDAMVREGCTPKEAASRFWCVDRQGLLTSDLAEQLPGHQATYARPASEFSRWKTQNPGSVTLEEVVRHVRPTILIGASTAGGTFTETIVREMVAHTARPIIFVLGTPEARAAACPADLIAWTEGRALIAAGSPFLPVTYKGVTYVVAHTNNAMLYPGLGLGAIVARATRISDGMLAAAANAVSSLVTVSQPGASLLPHIDDLRGVSATVAVSVAEAAEAEGLARAPLHDIVQQVRDAMWQPAYRPVQAC